VTKLQSFDFYSKVHDDYAVRTKSGGAISVAAMLTIVILSILEFRSYLTEEVLDHIVVDTTLNQKLPIGLNITFPRLLCEEISVDTVDSMGENQVDIHGGVERVDLNSLGHRLESAPRAPSGECQSCLAADKVSCCNTCRELRQAYSEADLPFTEEMVMSPQCHGMVGCQIHGDVLVSKVSGNVHVALGKATVKNGKHIHEFDIKDVTNGFNTSHVIHRLEFGNVVHDMTSPLEGTSKTVLDGAYMFHYYIKLVPTLFRNAAGEVVYTHQYSVTDNEKDVMPKKGELTGLPGVFLVYEFTPFMVKKIVKVVPLSHFLISLCAIIGGVFTVSGLIDTVLYRGFKNMKRSN